MSRDSEGPTAPEEELRIVVVGMRGTGKSSTGNTILGQKRFDTDYWRHVSPQCSKGSAVVDGQHLCVIDTFGPGVDRHCVALFTGGDQLEDPMEELLDRSPGQRELVARCDDRYHVFNNKQEDPSQVAELLRKISDLVRKNGGQHYTVKMLQEVTRETGEQKQPSQVGAGLQPAAGWTTCQHKQGLK